MERVRTSTFLQATPICGLQRRGLELITNIPVDLGGASVRLAGAPKRASQGNNMFTVICEKASTRRMG